MKPILFILFAVCIMSLGCKKIIDLTPQSNLITDTYYSNIDQVKIGLAGCYSGLIEPLNTEWMMTELRSDNTKQGATGSSTVTNRELNELDMFYLNSSHPRVYDYWLSTYNNIRNTNIILQKLGVIYDPAAGTTSLANVPIPVTDAERKQLAGEALFIRAYHYYNLVRLFGGVFLIHTPITPDDAKTMNRTTADEIYKLIQADLRTAADNMNSLKYTQVSAADLGRATGWSAKTLLAKVYLSLNKKAEAILLLNDVKTNSGHALVTVAGTAPSAYANVFSTANEVNAEIIFTIRYKAGGLGLGSPFANRFAPLNSGTAVVAGDGQGLNYPTAHLDSSIKTTDARKAVNVARYISGSTTRVYPRKFIPLTPITANDSESDWVVLRFADVLLMLAEAQGNSQSSIDNINLVRTRSAAPAISFAGITTTKQFEDTLNNERRIEFAFENQRWYDLLRFGTTLTTLTAESVMKDHFVKEFPVHYKDYPAPALTLAELQANITKDKLLLPIPQREIDTNTQLKITQNPGY